MCGAGSVPIRRGRSVQRLPVPSPGRGPFKVFRRLAASSVPRSWRGKRAAGRRRRPVQMAEL